ncbi:MAG TPA: enoyl-CoA hydratase-related protein [Nocardioidaceae bacterium]|nr:enoyl-CoA hydratase-related protein [Nocardioidaceae bacterium]
MGHAVTTSAGLRTATEGGVLTVTFARPEQRNAMTLQMYRGYYALLEHADTDPAVRAVVVTGEGDFFCSGADPTGLQALVCSEDARQALRDQLGFAPEYPLGLSKPLVAAVNGGAAGLGLVHALYADVRFVAEEAKLSTAFSRLGLPAEYGSSWLLPRLVGLGNAMDLLLSGRKIDATEALRIGLAQRVLPRAHVLEAAQAYARDLAQHCSPASLAVIKRQVHDDSDATVAASAGRAVDRMVEAFGRPDFAEGVAALVERRRPEFPPYTAAPSSGHVPDLNQNGKSP